VLPTLTKPFLLVAAALCLHGTLDGQLQSTIFSPPAR